MLCLHPAVVSTQLSTCILVPNPAPTRTNPGSLQHHFGMWQKLRVCQHCHLAISDPPPGDLQSPVGVANPVLFI